jgi:thiol:disulfide interchange protein
MTPARPHRRRVLALAALAPWLPALAGETRAILPSTFDPARDPAKDLEAALRIARAAGLRVLLDVGGEWCSWCHVLDRFFTANPDLKRYRDERYVWLKVNWSKESRNEAFLGRFPPIKGYPHFFVLDASGKLLHSQDTSLLESGKDYDYAAMRAFLVKWAQARGGAA